MRLFVAFGGVAMLMACAVAPTQEMSDARQAIQAARVAGAGSHSPNKLDRAETLLLGARSDLRQQDYGDARRKALAARKVALAARTISEILILATQAVTEGRKKGLDVSAAALYLSTAQRAARRGEMEKLRVLAAEVHKRVERAFR